MKIKKFITITLVTLLLFTSISTIATARITDDNDITIRSAFRGKIFDFLNRIRNQFQILSSFFNNLRREKPQEPYTPGTPETPEEEQDLSFEIILEKIQFELEEPIKVIATITNNGDSSVNLCDMEIRLGTIDFFIETEDSGLIHYIGPIFEKTPPTITIEPYSSISSDVIINSPDIIFGNDYSSGGTSQPPVPYEFKPGVYTIYGKYVSKQVLEPSSLKSDKLFWEGELISEPPLKFAILEKL